MKPEAGGALPIAPPLSVADAAKSQLMGPSIVMVDTSRKASGDPPAPPATPLDANKNVPSPVLWQGGIQVLPMPESPGALLQIGDAGAAMEAAAVAAAAAVATLPVRGGGVGEMMDRSAPWEIIVEIGGAQQPASASASSAASGGAPSGVNLHSLVREWAGLRNADVAPRAPEGPKEPVAHKGKWVNGQWVVPL